MLCVNGSLARGSLEPSAGRPSISSGSTQPFAAPGCWGDIGIELPVPPREAAF